MDAIFAGAINSPEIQATANMDAFYLQHCLDKYEALMAFDTMGLDLQSLINITKEKGFSYRRMLDSYSQGSREYGLLLLIGEVTSYCDVSAAMKIELNQYDDKRVIAKAMVTQNIWVRSWLEIKAGGNTTPSHPSVQNAIRFIQNPANNTTVLSANHRAKIEKHLFADNGLSIMENMDKLGVPIKNPQNRGVVYSHIIYHESVRKHWNGAAPEAEYLDIEDTNLEHTSYTPENFLQQAYIPEATYHTLTAILARKKNIILQGAPGVGKSFLAKKLAYAIMGYQDETKVAMVQFHQSYTYEDFIEGYRPSTDGTFILKPGIFKTFCAKAAQDENNQYFFIIDEINRGNLSKILGELMLLLEHDKRGQAYAIPLTYSGEAFYVPENVHIIGMMNTADRSLAMMDYALRRRFSFITIPPAFDSSLFQAHFAANYPMAHQVIGQMERLNTFIKDKLGAGYQIGHSYFCSNTPLTPEDVAHIFQYDIGELLEEYFFDDTNSLEIARQLISTSRNLREVETDTTP